MGNARILPRNVAIKNKINISCIFQFIASFNENYFSMTTRKYVHISEIYYSFLGSPLTEYILRKNQTFHCLCENMT